MPSCLISLAAKNVPIDRHHFASQANCLADILFPQETNLSKNCHASREEVPRAPLRATIALFVIKEGEVWTLTHLARLFILHCLPDDETIHCLLG